MTYMVFDLPVSVQRDPKPFQAALASGDTELLPGIYMVSTGCLLLTFQRDDRPEGTVHKVSARSPPRPRPSGPNQNQ